MKSPKTGLPRARFTHCLLSELSRPGILYELAPGVVAFSHGAPIDRTTVPLEFLVAWDERRWAFHAPNPSHLCLSFLYGGDEEGTLRGFLSRSMTSVRGDSFHQEPIVLNIPIE